MQDKQNYTKFHGRFGSGHAQCAYPACKETGEFRAPDASGKPASANGPGDYILLCLDHVRAFNAGYDWFSGMSAEEIAAAQSPIHPWATETRAFSAASQIDPMPKWTDFHDPLNTMSTRFADQAKTQSAPSNIKASRLSKKDRDALLTLGLTEQSNRKSIRAAYSKKVRKYHPDKNGGNRAYEKALQDAIAAYTHLSKSPAFP